MLRLLRGGRPPRHQRRESISAAADELAAVAREAGAGNARAIRTLVTSIGPALLKVVRGVLGPAHPDVEDVMQETAMAAVAALPRFEGKSSVLHFCCRVAVFTAISACRRAAARGDLKGVPIEDVAEGGDLTDSGPSPLAALIATRHRRTLQGLLARLPEEQAEALVQYVVLGWSVDEIGQTWGVSPNTVRSRLRLAKEALRKHIANGDLRQRLTDSEDLWP